LVRVFAVVQCTRSAVQVCHNLERVGGVVKLFRATFSAELLAQISVGPFAIAIILAGAFLLGQALARYVEALTRGGKKALVRRVGFLYCETRVFSLLQLATVYLLAYTI
jgi:hypothetical protein